MCPWIGDQSFIVLIYLYIIIFIYSSLFFLIYLRHDIKKISMNKKMFSTLLTNDLLKTFKKLAIDLERPVNDLLEESMRDLLKKYEKQEKKSKK